MTARVDFVVLVDVTCGGSGGELVAFFIFMVTEFGKLLSDK